MFPGGKKLPFLEITIKLNLFGISIHTSKYECVLTETLYHQDKKGKNLQVEQIIIHIWFTSYKKSSKSLGQRQCRVPLKVLALDKEMRMFGKLSVVKDSSHIEDRRE